MICSKAWRDKCRPSKSRLTYASYQLQRNIDNEEPVPWDEKEEEEKAVDEEEDSQSQGKFYFNGQVIEETTEEDHEDSRY